MLTTEEKQKIFAHFKKNCVHYWKERGEELCDKDYDKHPGLVCTKETCPILTHYRKLSSTLYSLSNKRRLLSQLKEVS